MKLLQKDNQRVVFQLGKREKAVLLELLKLYPVLPTSFQPLSQMEDPQQIQAAQELLEQSLAEHKERNQVLLKKMFSQPERLVETKTGWKFSLAADEVEWFLQVLNDIRVGSWRNAGYPDEQNGKPPKLTGANLKNLWAMEVAGAYQWQIIEALEGFGY